MAGLQQFIDAVDHLKFTGEDIDYLRSTSSTQASGYISAYFLKASYSVGNICTQLWAIVPEAGMPKSRAAMTQEVEPQPPM